MPPSNAGSPGRNPLNESSNPAFHLATRNAPSFSSNHSVFLTFSLLVSRTHRITGSPGAYTLPSQVSHPVFHPVTRTPPFLSNVSVSFFPPFLRIVFSFFALCAVSFPSEEVLRKPVYQAPSLQISFTQQQIQKQIHLTRASW